jgi:hypothetical protein
VQVSSATSKKLLVKSAFLGEGNIIDAFWRKINHFFGRMGGEILVSQRDKSGWKR